MKSALALLLALVVAFGGLLGWTNAQLQQQGTDVTVSATTLAGDPAAVADVQVTSYVEYQNHLFWRQSFPADSPEQGETLCTFSQAAHFAEDNFSWGNYFNIELSRHSISSHSSIEKQLSPSLLALLKQIQSNRPNVAVSQQRVDLSDYTDHYPLEVSGSFTQFIHDPLTSKQLIQLVEDYFFFPLSKSTYAIISLETDEKSGQLCGYDFDLEYDLSLSTQTVMRDYITYFALIPGGDQVDRLDTSHIPGGWGVYALTGTSGESAAISTLYSIPDGGQVVRLFGGPEGDDCLYLLTLEENTLFFTQLDPKNGQVVVHLPLFPWTEDQEILSTLWHGDYLVVFTGKGPFAVLVPDGQGGWKVDLTGDLHNQYTPTYYPSADELTGYARYSTTSSLYDHDSHRLIFADSYYAGDEKNTSFFLSVYDRDGLAYLGTYQFSLPADVYKLYGVYTNNSPSHVLSWSETAS